MEQIAEENKIKAQLEELDNKIDGIHSDHMNDLMGMRIQSQARGMLGKKQFTKKGEDVKAEKLAKDREIKAKSAIRIQAMVRGVLGREAYREKAPQLRIERKKRGSFCVECEDNVATKKCRQCEDRYCDTCFINIHRKGRRKKHNWVPISSESTRYATDVGADGESKPGSANNQAGEGKSRKSNNKKGPIINKKDWERFCDDTARAYYWFNAKTGGSEMDRPY